MFERQVRSILRRGYRPASATEALSGRGRLVHVTFDDAYRSVMAAMPALDRLGVPATVFACTNYANDGRPLDIPELAIEAGAHPGELATMLAGISCEASSSERSRLVRTRGVMRI